MAEGITQAVLEAAQREAIAEARRGAAAGELPYGAVVLSPTGEVVARAHDQVEADADETSHAESLVVRRASQARGRDLSGHRLVCTVEPCAMCFSAAWTAGFAGIAFGLTMSELKAAHPDSMDEIVIDSAGLNDLARRRLEIVPGLLRSECASLWN